VPDSPIVDLFAGPGGWDEGLRMLGMENVLGVEWDAAACATAESAFHKRLMADISKLNPADFDSEGLIASPSCTKFSGAGSGIGTRVMDHLLDGVRTIFAGTDSRVAVQAAILPACVADREQSNAKRSKPWTAEQIAAKAVEDAFVTALVLEPARWIMGMPSLRWIALEQVPQVLPLWDVYAECLREQGCPGRSRRTTSVHCRPCSASSRAGSLWPSRWAGASTSRAQLFRLAVPQRAVPNRSAISATADASPPSSPISGAKGAPTTTSGALTNPPRP